LVYNPKENSLIGVNPYLSEVKYKANNDYSQFPRFFLREQGYMKIKQFFTIAEKKINR